MKIALCQMKASKVTNVNYMKINRFIAEVIFADADIIMFPECALTGYPPIELPDPGSLNFNECDAYMDDLARETINSKLAILLGAITNKDGILQNSVKILQTGNQEYYSKKALWGWDNDCYAQGGSEGVFKIAGI